MHIGIAGPVATENVRHHLDGAVALPVGYPGAPLLGTLIDELIRRGHDISVFTTDKSLSRCSKVPIVGNGRHLRIYYCPQRPRAYRFTGTTPGRILDLFRRERRDLANVIRQANPEIVHAHWIYEFALAAIDAGKAHVITAHDSPKRVLRYTPTLYRLGRYVMARSALRQARHLTAVTPYLETELRSYARTRIQIVPNPLPRSIFDEQPNRSNDRSYRQRVVMVLNGWGRLKNAGAAFVAFGKLRKAIGNVRLSAIGYDFGPRGLAAGWCAKRGLAEAIDFLGPLPHHAVLDHLRNATILLHPALEEAHPMAVCEAMALGVPVIAGRKAGGIPWLLGASDAKSGLTDVADPDAIASVMTRILLDHDERRLLSAACRRRIEAICDPAFVAQEYERVYAEAVGVKRADLPVHPKAGVRT